VGHDQETIQALQADLHVLQLENERLTLHAEESILTKLIYDVMACHNTVADAQSEIIEKIALLMDLPITAIAIQSVNGLRIITSCLAMQEGNLDGAMMPFVPPECGGLQLLDVQQAAPLLEALGMPPLSLLFIPFISNNETQYAVFSQPEFSEDELFSFTNLVRVFETVMNQRMLEQRLHTSEKRYRTLFEQSNDAILLVNKEGKIRDSNACASLYFSYGKKQLSGRSIECLLVGAEHDCDCLDHLKQVMDQGGATCETVMRRRDGSTFAVEISSGVLEVDGEPHIQAIIRDVSERKEEEKKMIGLIKALDQAGDAIIITDAMGTIEYVNQSFIRITGYDKDEALGQKPSMLQSGRQDKTFYEEMWRQLTRNGAWQGVLWNKRKDGNVYPERLTIHAFNDDHHQTLGYVGVFSDISFEIKKQEQQMLEHKLEAIGVLIGGIAHHFNNMLMVIMGSTYVGRSKLHSDDDPVAVQLKTIENTADKAAIMVRKLMAFGHKTIAMRREVLLNALLLKVVEETRQMAICREVTISLNTEPETFAVYASHEELHMVMMNVIENSCRAMEECAVKHIQIELTAFIPDAEFIERHNATHSDSMAQLTVSDTGTGIKEVDLPHIFEPFYTTKEVGQGDGLGLSMVIGIIKSCGGIIEVESETDGTSIHMYLPRM